MRPCTDACAAARAIAHRRLLFAEAPESVPLPGCKNPDCRCRLERFDDRRAADERRMRDREQDAANGERRLPGDRRINKQRARPVSYFNDY